MRVGRGLGWSVVLAIVLAGRAHAQSAPPDLAIVQIDAGIVRGATAGDVISFKGIPYAEPPAGSLRWRAPQPVKPWSGERAAVAFGPSCPQTDDVPQSEDCLTLNVWRPSAASDRPLPVMVWIYGGALMHGRTSLYPADALARQGVVVVSMNYRMGRLGFFAHPALTAEASDEPHGNYGYLDQRAALHWVQRNIAAFGGDPNQVTIFGESAGGGSVMVHLTSPLSRGLFHRAILQSPGVPTARASVLPLTDLAEAERIGASYAQSVGVTTEEQAALDPLRALPASTLVEGASAQAALAALAGGPPVAGVAGAIRDGSMVAEAPEEAFAGHRQAMVPVIVGANDRDLGLGMASSKEEVFAAFGPDANEAHRLYDPRGDVTLEELKQQVFADRTLVEPSRHLADAMAKAGQPTWWYRFSYVAESQRGALKGTLHGFEIPYVFDIPGAIVGADKVTPDDRTMAELASAYWVAFAKTGDPNGGGRLAWPRHDPAVNRVMNFTNSGPIVGTDPLRARLDLWQMISGQASASPATDAQPISGERPAPVTLSTFVRAETDLYFRKTVDDDGFGRLKHTRQVTPIDAQDVVRMNRDTIYSSGVFDLEAAPVTITLPDPGKRFMSMQVVSEDHYTTEVVYAPGRHTYTKDNVGTRYVFLIVRTLADPQNSDDVKAANALQDAITVEQASPGRFEVPDWDPASQGKIRDALAVLGSMQGENAGAMFGTKAEVDPVQHLIGTAIGWGGNPRSAAVYRSVYPARNDGTTVHKLTVRDVPVDGFWSVSVYDAKGYFAKNDLGAYSLNNLTAKASPDGSYTIQFGGCQKDTPNCLPVMPGWNYTVRLYRPRQEILDGSWKFPEAQPVG